MTERQKLEFLGPYACEHGVMLADNQRCYVKTTQYLDRDFVRGSGSLVIDRNGDEFFDFTSRVGSSNIGQNDPEVKEIVIRHIEQYGFQDPVPHHESPNAWATALAADLCGLMPKQREWKCYLGNSGTEGVETALKMCKDYRFRNGQHRRQKMIAFDGSFNGRTLGALSFNNYPLHSNGYPLAYPDGMVYCLTYPASHPYFSRALGYRCDFSSRSPASFVENLLHGIGEDVESINALIVEDGVQGEGGMNVRSPEIFKELFAWCKVHDIFVIHDAVQSGIGRTGKMFAFEHDGFIPDILVSAKSLSGKQLSATICDKKLDFGVSGRHSSTNGGDTLLSLVSRVNLHLLRERNILEKVQADSRLILEPYLNLIAKTFPDFVHNVRNLGFMGGVEFFDAKTQKPDRSFAKELILCGLKRGILLMTCGLSGVRIMPPLTTSADQLAGALLSLEKSIRDVCNARAVQKH